MDNPNTLAPVQGLPAGFPSALSTPYAILNSMRCHRPSFDPSVTPTYHSLTPTGHISQAQSFSTRFPTSKTFELIRNVSRFTGLVGADPFIQFQRSDLNGLLNARLHAHLSTNPVPPPTLQAFHLAEQVTQDQAHNTHIPRNAARTGFVSNNAGSRITWFLRKQEMWNLATATIDNQRFFTVDVWDDLKHNRYGQAPSAGSGTADTVVMRRDVSENGILLGTMVNEIGEDKPKLSEDRQKNISEQANTIRGALGFTGFRICLSADDQWRTEPPSVINQSEMYCLIQAFEQCYANACRWNNLHGHEGITGLYLHSPNHVAVGSYIPEMCQVGDFSFFQYIIGALLPPTGAEPLAIPVPTLADLGVTFNDDSVSSADTPAAQARGSVHNTAQRRARQTTLTSSTSSAPGFAHSSSSTTPSAPIPSTFKELCVLTSTASQLALAYAPQDMPSALPGCIMKIESIADMLDGLKLKSFPDQRRASEEKTYVEVQRQGNRNTGFPSPPSSIGGSPLMTKTVRPASSTPQNPGKLLTPPPSPNVTLRGRLGKFLGYGRNGIVFRATIENVCVAIKLTLEEEHSHLESQTFSGQIEQEAEAGIEGAVLEHRAHTILADTSIAPRWFGSYHAKPHGPMGPTLWALVLEEVTHGLDERYGEVPWWNVLPAEIKLGIQSLYDRLHALHIVHGDLALRHIRVHPDGNLRLIDFEYSKVDADDNEVWEEKRDVYSRLGLALKREFADTEAGEETQ